jgi:hypothetical protein
MRYLGHLSVLYDTYSLDTLFELMPNDEGPLSVSSESDSPLKSLNTFYINTCCFAACTRHLLCTYIHSMPRAIFKCGTYHSGKSSPLSEVLSCTVDSEIELIDSLLLKCLCCSSRACFLISTNSSIFSLVPAVLMNGCIKSCLAEGLSNGFCVKKISLIFLSHQLSLIHRNK